MSLPHCETLLLEPVEGVLRIALNHPQSRNAINLAMVGELYAMFAAVRDDRSVRTLVLCGADEYFCAGDDIKDMAGARAAGAEAYRTLNRAFGSLLEEAQATPQLLAALVEDTMLGDGFGLACVSGVTITVADTQFDLSETDLDIPPAQIAPLVTRRVGLTQARHLALTAARFDDCEALRLGLVHFCEADADALEQRLEETLEQLRRCAPNADTATKALLLASESGKLSTLLDDAARQLIETVGGAEGSRDTLALVQRRKPVQAQ